MFLFGALVWVLFVPRASFFALYRKSAELQGSKEKTAALMEENARIRGEIESLRDDRFLEKTVRENGGFSRRGEYIYEFPKDTKKSK